MRRIVLFGMSTLTALVLLFGYHTSTSSKLAGGGDSSAVAPVTTGTGAGSSSNGSTGTSSTPPTGVADSSSAAAPSSVPSATVTGDAAQTRWGPVQVELTLTDGTITDVQVVEYPDGNGRDREINADALPILVQETMDAQSADIDMVSGATVTSDGYLTSLQSALDKAGL